MDSEGPSKRARTDDQGRAFAGSQLQIQIYVNRRTGPLLEPISDALPSFKSVVRKLTWVSPIESKQMAEYQDEAFLTAVGQAHLVSPLAEFWPRGGPFWDGLAATHQEGSSPSIGVLLVEAKSHVPEVYGNGCQASPGSRKKIDAALNRAKEWLGVPRGVDWMGPLYQSANRLAHLYFFREVAKVPAWLVNAYFVDDPHSPTSLNDWKAGQEKIKTELGLAGIPLPHCADIFLPALLREELLTRGKG